MVHTDFAYTSSAPMAGSSRAMTFAANQASSAPGRGEYASVKNQVIGNNFLVYTEILVHYFKPYGTGENFCAVRRKRERPMPDKTAPISVRVTKAGANGSPVAEIRVANNISAAQLGAALQKVVTNDQILKLGGLKACGGCKSGLDINILGGLQEIVQFEV